jgi:outer membrane receptor protein involved in Fe transport
VKVSLFSSGVLSGLTGRATGIDSHADASYRSTVTTPQINSSAAGYQQLGGYATVNASTGLLLGGKLRARRYVNNLTNQAGISDSGPVLKNANAYPDYREAYVIGPRTLGLSLQYSFE